jgi:hypothetical protein
MPSSSYVSPLALIASVMVGVLLGLGSFTFYDAKGTSYLSTTPPPAQIATLCAVNLMAGKGQPSSGSHQGNCIDYVNELSTLSK